MVPLLGVWDSFDEIDFDKLPDQFVLKANHGSGWNIIVKDKAKFDIEDAKNKFDQWMNTNFAFKWGLELHYMNIPPKIIAEKYIENMNQLYDYKVMCFGGKPYFIWVDSDRYTNHKRSLFTLDWKPMPQRINDKYTPIDDFDNAKPKNLKKMVELAGILSKGFSQVRVDFYEVEGKLYFGEMTFTSSSGTEKVMPDTFAVELGDMIKLPRRKQIPKRRLNN